MAVSVFDVGPFLEGVSNLQGKLEDAIAKSRLLLEAIEGSQSKYVEQNEDYPVLRSLKGRLAASQVPNESLATELVKFKLDLESFVDEIFQSQESVRRIRRDSILQAKELDLNRDKLWYEKGELAAERKRLELERKELDTVRLKLEKVPAKGDTGLGLTRNERTIESADLLDENSSKPNNNNYCSSKGVMNEFCDVGCQIGPPPEEGLIMRNVECQTELMVLKCEHIEAEREEETSGVINTPLVDLEKLHQAAQTKNSHVLSLRPQTSCKNAVSSTSPRVATAPVSRAKALLLTRQAQALGIHKTLIDEIYQKKQEVHSLKVENASLTKRANEANSELLYVRNQLTVNVADRDELQNKLHRCKEKIQKLEDTLKKQAFSLVHNKKHQGQLEEETRWSKILAVPPYRQSSCTDRGIYQEGINSKGHGRQSCKTCTCKITSKGRS
ncbi:PREDICTED: uncharacterized protein LOC107346431 isoform X2 [Acropora digitifera]|uniref:uncharacterized protein LOC107346431 isoform X2 n=1 Tax=Acropora digitifera TaxID=70779 RepID=UPI00077AE6EE|nr:PREDICTED: uncharacterized protein LOC107346431 isoform X2 [Acropora digitifera]